MTVSPHCALYTDPRFLLHKPTGFHPERPARLEAMLLGAKTGAPHAEARPGREVTPEEILRVHEGSFIDSLVAQLEKGRGQLDPDTYFSEGSRDAAWWAAGSACEMIDGLLSREEGIALLVPRPPGHHATRSQAMGFCLINHIAIAAAHARARGVERVAILDWDVHHGNGTQDVFYRDPNVLFFSLHQYPHFPGTGALLEHGHGDARGYTVNLPVPAGTQGATYCALFERVIVPVLHAARPQLLLISAGFDAHVRDPLGEILLEQDTYRWMASTAQRAMRSVGCRRVGVVLEGGYDLRALEEGTAATLQGLQHAMSESDEAVARPEGPTDQAVVDAAVKAHRVFWNAL